MRDCPTTVDVSRLAGKQRTAACVQSAGLQKKEMVDKMSDTMYGLKLSSLLLCVYTHCAHLESRIS